MWLSAWPLGYLSLRRLQLKCRGIKDSCFSSMKEVKILFEPNLRITLGEPPRTLSYFLLSKILILATEMKKKTIQNTSLSFWWQREEELGAEVATQDDWMWLCKPCHQTDVKFAMQLQRCHELAEVRKLPYVLFFQIFFFKCSSTSPFTYCLYLLLLMAQLSRCDRNLTNSQRLSLYRKILQD